MVNILSLMALTFAVSLDSFSVGFTYGLRKVQIPFKSILIISCCSAISLLLAMFIGQFLGSVLSPHIAERVGGSILMVLGFWILFQFFRPEKLEEEMPDEKIIFTFEIKSLGVAINILRKPLTADFDRSGTINGIEALVLGFALSLDAFGAGIGAAMLDFSPFILATSIAVMSLLFIVTGLKCGKLLSSKVWLTKLSFLPGILLFAIGLWKW
ncbi:sporulation membrane protein YtaF [Peribacillus alkalitolerans]|uniref:sporulation membrane protein YtaF n=1 Tax=Peribacillus alkalitolerans TaxID=1550385 RepID=UPI0013D1D5B8|nr:sporulation membrane protein YtaF [Peribacillus alkalitolerans]